MPLSSSTPTFRASKPQRLRPKPALSRRASGVRNCTSRRPRRTRGRDVQVEAAAPVTRTERLPVAQERDLVVAAEAGDEDACRLLVETFLPEINGVARRFERAGGVERRDLVREGVVALLFAARRYDARLET